MKSTTLRILFAYILICLIWGTTWLAIKIGLQTIPPFFSASIRFVIAVAILATMIYSQRLEIPTNRNAIRVYLVLGILSFSIPFSLIYWGQQYINTGMGAILFGVYPFLVAINSSLFLKTEKMTLFKILGITVGFSGLIILFIKDIRFENPLAFYGAAAVVISAAIQSFTVVYLKKNASEISSTAMNFVGMSIGAIFLMLFSIATESYATLSFTPAAILSILYLGGLGSVVTFNTYFWLLKRVDTVILSLSALITPVIAVISGVVFLDEHFSSDMAIGSSLVLFGIFLANWEGLKEKLLHRRNAV